MVYELVTSHPLRQQFRVLKNHVQSLLYVGAYLLFPRGSTIGDGELNCRVRNENGCTLSAKAPTFNLEFYYFVIFDLNTVKWSLQLCQQGMAIWSGQQDSNLRPSHPDCDAPPDCAMARPGWTLPPVTEKLQLCDLSLVRSALFWATRVSAKAVLVTLMNHFTIFNAYSNLCIFWYKRHLVTQFTL